LAPISFKGNSRLSRLSHTWISRAIISIPLYQQALVNPLPLPPLDSIPFQVINSIGASLDQYAMLQFLKLIYLSNNSFSGTIHRRFIEMSWGAESKYKQPQCQNSRCISG
jgi:hypothetical protein